MKKEKNQEYILLGGLILLNILLRVPFIPHEFGADSFFIHTMANQIVEYETAPWIIHPLSFFGLYPLSNASVVPMLLAVLSFVSGVGMEHTILYASMAFSILGAVSAYALAGRIKTGFQFKFVTAFLFSTSPLALKFTGWTISTRGLFIMLIPLFMWSILKFMKDEKIKLETVLTTTILLLTLAGTHKMFALTIPLIIILPVSFYLRRFFNKTHPLIITSVFSVLFFIQFFLYRHWWTFLNLPFMVPRTGIYSFISLLIVLNMRLGVIAPLSLIGFIAIVFTKKKPLIQNYLLLITLAFTPFISYDMYFYQTFSIIAVVYSAFSLDKILTLLKNPNIQTLVITAILVSSIGFSLFTQYYRFTKIFGNLASQYFDSRLFSLAMYLNMVESGIIETPTASGEAIKLSAYVDNPSIPMREPSYFGYGLVDEKSIQIKTRSFPNSIQTLKIYLKYPFISNFSIIPHETKYYFLNKVTHPNSLGDNNFGNKTKIFDNGFEELLIEERV